MADLYRTKIEELAAALQREDARSEASETLRGLIDAIILMPEKGQLRIELRGFIFEVVAARVARAPKSPKTIHYRGSGLFMLSGPTVSTYRKLFDPDRCRL